MASESQACATTDSNTPSSRWATRSAWRWASLLAQALEAAGYVSNAAQNETVLSIMRHAFSTIPGILWVATAAALFFYKLNKRTYNRIVEVIRHRAAKKRGLRSIAK